MNRREAADVERSRVRVVVAASGPNRRERRAQAVHARHAASRPVPRPPLDWARDGAIVSPETMAEIEKLKLEVGDRVEVERT